MTREQIGIGFGLLLTAIIALSITQPTAGDVFWILAVFCLFAALFAVNARQKKTNAEFERLRERRNRHKNETPPE